MSLINDALRRSSQSKSPPATPAETPPLQPVEPVRSHANLALVLAPVIILLLGLAGWFWIKWWESSIQLSQSPNPVRVTAREFPRAPNPSTSLAQGDEPAPREPFTPGSASSGFPKPRANVGPGPVPGLPSRTGRIAPAAASALVETSTTVAGTNTPPIPTGASQAIAPDPASTPAPTFKLQGIFYRPTNPSAVINSKVVYVGDKVGQARVLAIEMDEVLIEYKGQKSVLSLP